MDCPLRRHNWPAIGFVILPNLGLASDYFSKRKADVNWCKSLKTPSWNLSNCAYNHAWASMYCSIGYASYLVFKEGGGCNGAAKLPLAIYGANLLANWAWSPIFFGCKNIKLALVDIAIIDVTAIGMAVTFYKIHRVAGLLIVPYCLWLGFATALNYCLYRDNKEVKEN